MHGLRLTPFGKFLSLVVSLAFVAIVVGAAGASAQRPHAQAWRCVTVRPGDTLWGIARRSDRGDPRAVVHRIVEENGLRDATIHPGAALWVPRSDGGSLDAQEVDGARCTS